MRALFLTLTVLVMYHKASFARSLNANSRDIVAKRSSLAIKRSHISEDVPEGDFGIESTHDMKLDDENSEKLKTILEEILHKSMEYGPAQIKSGHFGRKRVFPQSFESLIAGIALRNEMQKKENEKSILKDDLLKVAEDLAEVDVSNIDRKRKRNGMDDSERPPKVG